MGGVETEPLYGGIQGLQLVITCNTRCQGEIQMGFQIY